MAQPFVFPPPPPPPPRKQSIYPTDCPQPNYSTPYDRNARGRGASIGRGQGRGQSSIFRGHRGGGRGVNRRHGVDRENRNVNFNFNSSKEIHKNPLGSPYLERSPQSDPSSPNLGLKRPFSAAFEKPANPLPRPQAAPAVPSFGGDLHYAAPSSEAQPTTLKKKARKHNQLGLTPASQDHESSSGEDEEAKLADGTGTDTGTSSSHLQFEYRGRTAVLRSAADIAAWIAERRRNFPTAAKAEAAKKETEERRQRLMESRTQRIESSNKQRLEEEKAEQEALRKKVLESVAARKANTGKDHEEQERGRREKSDDGTTQILSGGAELKRKSGCYQGEPVVAEGRLTDTTLSNKDQANGSDKTSKSQTTNDTTAIATPSAKTEDMAKMQMQVLEGDGIAPTRAPEPPSTISLSDLDSDDDDEDATSSSGSSTLSSSSASTSAVPGQGFESDSSSDSSAAPSEHTSKRTQPDRVAPPPRLKPGPASQPAGVGVGVDAVSENRQTRIPPCRNLVRTGHCSFGDRCRYSHDLPEDVVNSNNKDRKKPNQNLNQNLNQKQKQKQDRENKKSTSQHSGRRTRTSLYQVLVAKEQEAERREVLRIIVEMGSAGILSEDGDGRRAGDGVGLES